MNIAIISDIHQQQAPLLAALQAAKKANCQALLCLGDFEKSHYLELLRKNWDGPLHFVLGNNDWPAHSYENIAAKWPNTTYHGDRGELCLDGRKILITHYPEVAQKAAQFGNYDAIFYGHTHIAAQHMDGPCLLANPGEIQGRTGKRSWAIYETKSNSLQHITLH